MSPRKNNLGLVRLLAACLVIYTHSLVLLGQSDPQMLWKSPGAIGVYIFFALSGFLIARSWDADPHLGRFLARRGSRIFPGLAVCILVLGPVLTMLTEYTAIKEPLPRLALDGAAAIDDMGLSSAFS